MNNNNYCFLSNNVKGIKTSAKRLKIFKYLNSKANKNGNIFLQETHSSIDDEKIGKMNLMGHFSFRTVVLIHVGLL